SFSCGEEQTRRYVELDEAWNLCGSFAASADGLAIQTDGIFSW
ncbi:hypothetical protein Tco_0554916, partial [Tanacetum coccineum]